MRALFTYRPSKRTLLFVLIWSASYLVWEVFDIQSRRVNSAELLMRGVPFLFLGFIVLMLSLISAVFDTVQDKRRSKANEEQGK